MFFKKLLFLFLLFSTTISCVDDLDFSQIEDYNTVQEFTSSITYFKILPFQFFNQTGVHETERTDVTDFKILENGYFRDNLIRLDFNIEIKNEYDNDFTIQVDFLDNNNFLTHKFQEIKVNANNLDYKFSETIKTSDNRNITNTVKVRVTVKIDNSSTPLNPSDTSEFEFKSSAKIYLNAEA